MLLLFSFACSPILEDIYSCRISPNSAVSILLFVPYYSRYLISNLSEFLSIREPNGLDTVASLMTCCVYIGI